MQGQKKVAIVGSGISGIGALWALNQTTDHEVHLFEASHRLGGHTNTVPWEHNGNKTLVDTGFIVMNSATYPNFIAFLKELNIKTCLTEMTFGVSRDQGRFEWAGASLSAVFAQRKNLFSPRMWLMIFDIIRFNKFALDLLIEADESEEDPSGAYGTKATFNKSRKRESVGQYLKRHGYSDAFRDDYLLPMTAAVWSTGPDKCSLDFPILTLIRFMWNHHLLTTVSTRPPWMTIPGCSQQYIDAVMADVPQSRVHLSTRITSLTNEASGQIGIHTHSGAVDVFDHVILATHGDQAMDIIRATATPEEAEIMSAFKTSTNTAVLHSDLSLMPRRPIAYSAWNFLTSSSSLTTTSVCLTYYMNILQLLPLCTYGPVLVTLNPLHPPSPPTVQGSWTYNHPLYNAASVRSQHLLPRIQNQRGISYAGAWTKYGFHEDGFSSGVKVAMEHLGAKVPWRFVDSTFSRGRRPQVGRRDLVIRIGIRWMQIMILVFQIMWIGRLGGLIGAERRGWGARNGLGKAKKVI